MPLTAFFRNKVTLTTGAAWVLPGQAQRHVQCLLTPFTEWSEQALYMFAGLPLASMSIWVSSSAGADLFFAAQVALTLVVFFAASSSAGGSHHDSLASLSACCVLAQPS